MRNDIWSILGLEPTDDQRAIKRAYAKQSRLYHPEEYPEEFKELQAAYQAALQLARLSPPAPIGTEDDWFYEKGHIAQDLRTFEDKNSDTYHVTLGEEVTREIDSGLFRSSSGTISDEEQRFLDRIRMQLPLGFQASEVEYLLKRALFKGYLGNEAMRQEIEDCLEQIIYDNSDSNIARLRAVYEQYQLTRSEQALRSELLRRGYTIQNGKAVAARVEEETSKKSSLFSVFKKVWLYIIIWVIIMAVQQINSTHSDMNGSGFSRLEYRVTPDVPESDVEEYLDNRHYEQMPLVTKEKDGYYIYKTVGEKWYFLGKDIEVYILPVKGKNSGMIQEYVAVASKNGWFWTIYDGDGGIVGFMNEDNEPHQLNKNVILVRDISLDSLHIKP